VTDGIDLQYTVEGPPGRPVVVLAHAIGMSNRMWDPQVAALASAWRVVRLDLRGHGGSPVPAGPYTLGELGADVLGVLDRLSVQRAAIVGLSLGAMVGLWLAANAPERVERLVAACAIARPASPQAWHERGEAVLAGGTVAVADLVVERWGYANRDAAIESILRTSLAATPPVGYAGCCEAIATMDLRGALGRIQAPTLLLAGADDPAAPPAVANEIAAAVAGSRVEVVEGAAHLLNVERADVVTEAILQHLRR
jgi:3-oxoadipate enol-lactonase